MKEIQTNPNNEVIEDNAESYFSNNIEAAKTDFNKAVDLYLNYVGKSETDDQRMDRINRFRSGN